MIIVGVISGVMVVDSTWGGLISCVCLDDFFGLVGSMIAVDVGSGELEG